QDQQNQQEALKRTAAEERARAENLALQLQRDAGRLTAPTAPIVSLVLIPGAARRETTRERLVVPASAQLARIEVRLEARDQYPQFRAELRTRSGQEILVQNNLRPQRSSTGPAVVFDIPASTLSTGD